MNCIDRKAFVSVFMTLSQGLYFRFDTQIDTHMLEINIFCEFVRSIFFSFFCHMCVDIHGCLYV